MNQKGTPISMGLLDETFVIQFAPNTLEAFNLNNSTMQVEKQDLHQSVSLSKGMLDQDTTSNPFFFQEDSGDQLLVGDLLYVQNQQADSWVTYQFYQRGNTDSPHSQDIKTLQLYGEVFSATTELNRIEKFNLLILLVADTSFSLLRCFGGPCTQQHNVSSET